MKVKELQKALNSMIGSGFASKEVKIQIMGYPQFIILSAELVDGGVVIHAEQEKFLGSNQ